MVGLRIGCVMSLLLAGTSASAAVQVESLPSRQESQRALDDHVFQLSSLVQGPFTPTAFGAETVGGYGETLATLYDRNGNVIGSRNYPVGTFGQGFDYQLSLVRGGLDVGGHVQVSGFVFTGLSGPAALVVGASLQYAGSVGVTLGHTFGAWRGAVTLDLGVRPDASLLILNGVLSALQSRSFDDSTFLTATSRGYFSPGVSLAWAPQAWLGLLAEAHFTFTRLQTGTDVKFVRNGSAAAVQADFDLDPLIHVPLGLLGVYRLDLPVGTDGLPRIQQIGGGFFYTGRVRLELGLQLIYRTGNIRPEQQRLPLDLNATVATIILRYHW